MTVYSVTKSHVNISSHNSGETYNVMISKNHTNVQLHKKFTKCDDLYYLEITIELRSITIIFV